MKTLKLQVSDQLAELIIKEATITAIIDLLTDDTNAANIILSSIAGALISEEGEEPEVLKVNGEDTLIVSLVR